MVGDELVDGDGVFEACEARVFGGGKPSHFGGVTVGAILFLVLEAGDDGEVGAEVLEGFEVGGEGVVGAGFVWEEEGRVEAEGGAHGEESWGRLSDGGLGAGREGGQHGIEEGQGESGAGAAEEGAAVEVTFGGKVHGGVTIESRAI